MELTNHFNSRHKLKDILQGVNQEVWKQEGREGSHIHGALGIMVALQ